MTLKGLFFSFDISPVWSKFPKLKLKKGTFSAPCQQGLRLWMWRSGYHSWKLPFFSACTNLTYPGFSKKVSCYTHVDMHSGTPFIIHWAMPISSMILLTHWSCSEVRFVASRCVSHFFSVRFLRETSRLQRPFCNAFLYSFNCCSA